MTSTSIFSKLGATIAAASVPAMLFLGAGTAHAQQRISVGAMSAPGGVNVFVESLAGGGEQAPSGWCNYTSTVQGDPVGKPAPALGVPFFLSPATHSALLWFPSYPTGSTWNVTVSCPNGVASTQAVW